METIQLLLQAPRRNIVLLRGIIEGYEGVAILRTVNATQDLLELLVAPSFHDTVRDLLHALTHEMDLYVLDANHPLLPLEMQRSNCDRC
jgi:uncharacterized protein DUF4911